MDNQNNIGVPTGGRPMSDYHPKCDCHSCTQIRGQERNPFHQSVPAPWVCWCGKNYPHACTWAATSTPLGNHPDVVLGLPCQNCGVMGLHNCLGGQNDQGSTAQVK